MTAGTKIASPGVRSALPLTAERRRRWFYPKTDIEIDDRRLRELRREASETLARRSGQAAALAGDLGLGAAAASLSVGTFHVVHAIGAPQAQWVMRSTLDDLFVEDRSLLLEQAVRGWLGADSGLVPATQAVRFASAGAPFDFAVLARSANPTLRDIGDPVLDEEPRWLVAIGELLARLHGRAGAGAGLIDLDDLRADQPRGVHRSWTDYLFLNLHEHLGRCERAGFLSGEETREILDLTHRARPLVAECPARLLHGDLGLHNLCVDAQTRRVVHVLDWEDALVGDPLFDVAMTLTFQPARRHAAILAGYGLASPSREQQALLALYFLRISLSKTVHRLRFGAVDLPGREPAHHRIDRGLRELARLI